MCLEGGILDPLAALLDHQDDCVSKIETLAIPEMNALYRLSFCHDPCPGNHLEEEELAELPSGVERGTFLFEPLVAKEVEGPASSSPLR